VRDDAEAGDLLAIDRCPSVEIVATCIFPDPVSCVRNSPEPHIKQYA